MKLIKRLLVITLLFLMNISAINAQDAVGITSQAHVESRGWLNTVGMDEVIGTVGEGKSLEAFCLNSDAGDILYSSHVSTIGWQETKMNGEQSGTTGQDLPIEAVKIELGENLRDSYDVYYRVHSAYVGWLDWASNGAEAGTTGLSLPAQAIQIRILAKDEEFTESTENPLITGDEVRPYDTIEYDLHCAGIGWQGVKANGETAGTIGENRQAEAIRINAPDIASIAGNSSLSYEVHGQGYGWQPTVTAGEVAGTEGQGKSMQAIRIRVGGLAGVLYNVYYRTHVANFGWLDWAMNGQESGTTGLNLPIQAIEIVMLPKASAAPGVTDHPFYSSESIEGLAATVQVSVENIGWMDPAPGYEGVGTQGQSLGIEALKISVPQLGNNSNIVYNLYLEDIGWQGEHQNNDIAGTTGQDLQSEAISIRLTGTIASLFDVYYQVHSQDIGWLGWTCNDQWAGTSKGNKKIEALRVVLIRKGDPAPDNHGIVPYKEVELPKEPEPSQSGSGEITADDVPNFNLICAIVQHEGGSTYEGALAVMSCVMNRCDSGRWGGTDPVSVLTAPGQFASYLDGYYRQFLNNPSPVVQQAVLDCLNGVRSHPYESFRSYATSGSVCIGGNWFF